MTAAPALAQRLGRFIEALPQLHDFGRGERLLGLRLRLRHDCRQQAVARTEGPQPLQEPGDEPAADDDCEDNQPG